MTRVGRFVNRHLPFVALALALAATAIGGAGCDTYHYYDMSLMFGSGWTGGINSAGDAVLCRVTVSGADSHSFVLDKCGISTNAAYPDVGTFEFATFADSGTLTFTVDAYNGTPTTAACLFGTGVTNIPASSTITQMGEITVNPDGTGCPNN